MNKDETAPYHHGNLRAELLKAAAEELQSVGVEKLSMRAVSRALGVSQSAPFRHFKNKNELLVALAVEGFHQLTQCQRESKEGLAPHDALLATGISYVDFACTHPALFKLMFGSQIEGRSPDTTPELCVAGDETYDELQRTIAEGIQHGSFRDRSVEEVAFAAWSMVHGLAHLSIDGSGVNVPDDAKHAMIRSSLEIFMMGVCR